jgi:hypothetical protein
MATAQIGQNRTVENILQCGLLHQGAATIRRFQRTQRMMISQSICRELNNLLRVPAQAMICSAGQSNSLTLGQALGVVAPEPYQRSQGNI